MYIYQTEKELQWHVFLGTRLFGIYSRNRRRSCLGLYLRVENGSSIVVSSNFAIHG